MQQYHPRRKRNEIIDATEKAALLKFCNHVTIALCDGETPYIVTMSYGFDADNSCLYFHCANHGDKLDFIRKNPKACATVIKDNGYLQGDCDHDYESLVIRGEMHIVSDLNEKKHGLQVLLNHLEKAPPAPESSSRLTFRLTCLFHDLRPIMMGSALSDLT